jgi:hypothetical protein
MKPRRKLILVSSAVRDSVALSGSISSPDRPSRVIRWPMSVARRGLAAHRGRRAQRPGAVEQGVGLAQLVDQVAQDLGVGGARAATTRRAWSTTSTSWRSSKWTATTSADCNIGFKLPPLAGGAEGLAPAPGVPGRRSVTQVAGASLTRRLGGRACRLPPLRKNRTATRRCMRTTTAAMTRSTRLACLATDSQLAPIW